MKIHLHDHSGHLFTAELSRMFARDGHQVVHGFSAQFESPHGRLELRPDDPPGLTMQPVRAAAPFSKYSPLARSRYELSYARAWKRHLRRERPDVVLACNVPLLTLASMQRYFGSGQPWVLWHQDIYSRAIADEAARMLPRPLAASARAVVERLERAQVQRADAVIALSDAFVEQYREWGLSTEHVQVLANWGPIAEIAPRDRENPWTRERGLEPGRFRLLYAGTVGRKHNPRLLVELLEAVRARGLDAHLLVVSEGEAVDELAAGAGRRPDVTILPFQPAERVADMLASADVCLALLEPSASRFSVPSKVLSYLCAGRPTVALMPADNEAAIAVTEAGGLAVAPSAEGAQRAADWIVGLAEDEARWAELGASARRHAQEHFDVAGIAAAMGEILTEVAARRRPGRAT